MADDFKADQVGHGTSSFDGWSVEARCLGRPHRVGEYLLGESWTRINFPKTLNIGVPIGPSYHQHDLHQRDLLSYASAQALRWWLHAIGEAQTDGAMLDGVLHRAFPESPAAPPAAQPTETET